MMPATAKHTELGFVSWNAPEVASTIEYPLEVMDEIRAFVCNELLQLSHGGAEVGGVMYGSRRPDAIRILTWRPIASEYADGETLRLSHRDRMNLAVQLEVARGNPDLKDLRPVGWFVSHPNGEVAMTSSDLEVYEGFFPESSQVTLVIHPTGGGRAEAGFFVRAADGSVRSDASYQNFVLEPLNSPPTQAPAAQAPAAQAAPTPPPARSDVEPVPQKITPESNGAPPSAPGPSLAAPSFPASNFPASNFPAPDLPAPSFAPLGIDPLTPDTPIFNTPEPVPARERWLWAIPIALALGLAVWMLDHRQKPVESPPMAFHISSNAARTVQLEWAPNSRAIRDSDHGEIDITDDGRTSQVALSRDQLHSGRMAYLRQSGDVGFQFTIYPTSGAPVHESTRLIAPAFSAPAQPPQLLPVGEDDAAQRRIRQLTEDLRKERARADQLQNLVRILENRLGVQPEAPKAEPQR
jgi:hypothetical protein